MKCILNKKIFDRNTSRVKKSLRFPYRFDLSESLSRGGESGRDHIVYIHQHALQEDGIHALRHHQFKAHFTTEGNIFSTNEDLECSQRKQVISYSFLTVLY